VVQAIDGVAVGHQGFYEVPISPAVLAKAVYDGQRGDRLLVGQPTLVIERQLSNTLERAFCMLQCGLLGKRSVSRWYLLVTLR
jgi:hypothetical protein